MHCAVSKERRRQKSRKRNVDGLSRGGPGKRKKKRELVRRGESPNGELPKATG